MKLDPDDRYEPDDEHGWCSCCRMPCIIIGVDEGIGGYEVWGFRGGDVDIRPASDCCKEPVLEYDPEEESVN